MKRTTPKPRTAEEMIQELVDNTLKVELAKRLQKSRVKTRTAITRLFDTPLALPEPDDAVDAEIVEEGEDPLNFRARRFER